MSTEQKKDNNNSALVTLYPSVDIDAAEKYFRDYQELSRRILDSSDVMKKKYTDKKTGEIKEIEVKIKSAWRKLAWCYRVSTEIIEERKETITDENFNEGFVYHFKVKAASPNGREMPGIGSCSSLEKGIPKTEHNARGIAHTRATNRAISDLLGLGELSGEELDDDEDETGKQSKPSKPKEQVVDPYGFVGEDKFYPRNVSPFEWRAPHEGWWQRLIISGEEKGFTKEDLLATLNDKRKKVEPDSTEVTSMKDLHYFQYRWLGNYIKNWNGKVEGQTELPSTKEEIIARGEKAALEL